MQMLDQGVELILEGVKAEGLDAAMALQDFAGAHQLARFAIDQSDGLEILWQPEPPTMRFGDVTVEVPPLPSCSRRRQGRRALVDAVRRAIGAAGAVADLVRGRRHLCPVGSGRAQESCRRRCARRGGGTRRARRTARGRWSRPSIATCSAGR